MIKIFIIFDYVSINKIMRISINLKLLFIGCVYCNQNLLILDNMFKTSDANKRNMIAT